MNRTKTGWLRGGWALGMLLPMAAQAQYVGKVQTETKEPALRATAVYEWTGSPAKPNASRLVPVVVWDGDTFQPGGLYLAQPEPLTVAPGTEYVLQKTGEPSGLFEVQQAGTLRGAWVGMGVYKAEAPPPVEPKLAASKRLPALVGGGRGHVRVDDDDANGGPALHRHAGSEEGSTAGGAGATGTNGKPTGSGGDNGPVLHRKDSADAASGSSSGSSSQSSGSGNVDPDRPTLHRRDDSGSSTSSGSANGSTTSSPSSPAPANGGSSGSSTNNTQASPDPDRPTLHRKDDSGGSTTASGAPDPDRPHLHRVPGSGGAAPAIAADEPDPDRPHLRYGRPASVEALGRPTELKDVAVGPGTMSANGVPVEQMVAVSDRTAEPPHSFAYTWPNANAESQVRAEMHAMAVHALAATTAASFGPAAAADSALKRADAQEQADFGPASHASFGPAAQARAKAKKAAADASDPLQDQRFAAFALSYDGAVAYVFSAHTAAEGADRRYVTVMAQPGFSGEAHLVFSQTTRGDTLGETPALNLIDAVDADGDHRAELLFEEQASAGAPDEARRFVLFRVLGGQAEKLYETAPGAAQ